VPGMTVTPRVDNLHDPALMIRGPPTSLNLLTP
jgi:hypothetical protein